MNRLSISPEIQTNLEKLSNKRLEIENQIIDTKENLKRINTNYDFLYEIAKDNIQKIIEFFCNLDYTNNIRILVQSGKNKETYFIYEGKLDIPFDKYKNDNFINLKLTDGIIKTIAFSFIYEIEELN